MNLKLVLLEISLLFGFAQAWAIPPDGYEKNMDPNLAEKAQLSDSGIACENEIKQEAPPVALLGPRSQNMERFIPTDRFKGT